MKKRDFNISLKKGEIGEQIIRKYLENKGWIVYCPVTKNKPHYFDQLVTKDKKLVIAIDIKTKARLNKWEAQGINIKTYNEYIGFINKINIPFYLVFIDDKTGDVYAQELRKLKNPFKPTPYIFAWYLKDMKYLFNIGVKNIKLLSEFDQRNYKFQPTKIKINK